MEPILDTIAEKIAITDEQRAELGDALAARGVVSPDVLVEVCDLLTERETDKALRRLSAAMNGERS